MQYLNAKQIIKEFIALAMMIVGLGVPVIMVAAYV
jgi:hypothetical protein